LKLFGRRITLDWWSVILASALAIAIVAGWLPSVPW
jgi:hypothetical protein